MTTASDGRSETPLLIAQLSFMSATSPPPATASSDTVPAHHANSVVAFIIGLAIILLASILNAAGLNLTKLDHVSVVHGAIVFSRIHCVECRLGQVLYLSLREGAIG